MPPAVIAAVIGAGASLAGAKIASSGAHSAADTQAKSASDALGFEREQYARSQQNLAPFMNLGASALPQLQSLAGRRTPNLGLPGNVYNPTPSAPPAGPMGGGSPYDTPFAAPPRSIGYGQTPAAANAGGDTVLMRAPNGTTKAIPRAQVAHYTQLGAQVVG